MQKLLEKYNIELNTEEKNKFKEFLTLFIEKNSKINLSAIRDEKDIIEKHFIDSIMLNIFLNLNSPLPLGEGLGVRALKKNLGGIKVADIWTGWGFPLIPLAITNKKIEFTWIDSVWKKLKAVDEFVLNLWLKNVKTINSRAEDLGNNLEYRESFNYVTSRATAYFPTLLEYVIPLLKVGWIFIAYKLDDKEEIKSAKKALMKLWSKILKVKNYKIWEQKRTLVFIEKLKQTHKKYPRKVWEPLKNPL